MQSIRAPDNYTPYATRVVYHQPKANAMPPPVDHDARRQLVIAVARRLVASKGLDALSMRAVATRAGYSTSIVTHYFRDKNDLIRSIYIDAATRSRQRLMAALAEREERLRRGLQAMLPVDEGSRRDWKIYFAYMGSSVAASPLTKAHAKWMSGTLDLLGQAIAEEIVSGALPQSLDSGTQAQRLLNFVTGIGIMATINRTEWPAARIEECLRQELEFLRRCG